MKKKIIFGIIIISIVIGGFTIVGATIPSYAADPVNCIENPEHLDCQPARLREVQDVIVRLIYIAWALGIPLFGISAAVVGYQYMFAGSSEQKQQELRKRVGYIIVGVIIFLATYPVANFMMGLFVTSQSDCYAHIDTPGFTFFFPNVCSGEVYGKCCTSDTDCPGAENVDVGIFVRFIRQDQCNVVSTPVSICSSGISCEVKSLPAVPGSADELRGSVCTETEKVIKLEEAGTIYTFRCDGSGEWREI